MTFHYSRIYTACTKEKARKVKILPGVGALPNNPPGLAPNALGAGAALPNPNPPGAGAFAAGAPKSDVPGAGVGAKL